MAARDRSEYNIRCTTCDKTGVLKTSENDYPFMRKLGFQVDALSEGFKVAKLGNSSVDTDIICSTCSKKVW